MSEPYEDLAGLYVLDRLNPSERAAFESRLALDPELLALVRELETVFARHIRALPQYRPSEAVLAQIQERIANFPSSNDEKPRGAKPHWPMRAYWRWGAAAAIGFGLLVGARQYFKNVRRAEETVVLVDLYPRGNSIEKLKLPTSSVDADVRFIELASLAERFSQTATGEVERGAQRSVLRNNYALFDPRSRQGIVVLQQLPTAPRGERYCIWLLNTVSRTVERVGVIPSKGERGIYSFNLEAGPEITSDHTDIFVTTEGRTDSPSASARPTGKVVLGKEQI